MSIPGALHHRVDRISQRREGRPGELPVPEVPRDDDDPPALLEGGIQRLQSLDSHQAPAYLGQAPPHQGRKRQRLAPDMPETGSGRAAHPCLVPIGERAGELGLDHVASQAQAIRQRTERLAQAFVEGGRAAGQRTESETRDGVLEELTESLQRTLTSPRSTPSPPPNCIS